MFASDPCLAILVLVLHAAHSYILIPADRDVAKTASMTNQFIQNMLLLRQLDKRHKEQMRIDHKVQRYQPQPAMEQSKRSDAAPVNVEDLDININQADNKADTKLDQYQPQPAMRQPTGENNDAAPGNGKDLDIDKAPIQADGKVDQYQPQPAMRQLTGEKNGATTVYGEDLDTWKSDHKDSSNQALEETKYIKPHLVMRRRPDSPEFADLGKEASSYLKSMHMILEKF